LLSRAGVRTMSSSKIIRKGGEPQTSFTLGPLGGELPKQEVCGFRAVQLGAEDQELEPEDLEPYQPPPCIPEEEALRRISQAHADGVKEGKKNAEAALAKVSEALGQALLATGSLRGRLMQESEEDLLKLSTLIARTVMLRQVACNPGILAQMVREAVELASDGSEVVVRLNPEDYAQMVQLPEFAGISGEKQRVSLKGDPAVPSAGCLVETARGNIDAGLESQLDEIYRRLCEEKCARRGEQHGAD
jgi:flagellar assembly protein FliH